MEKRKNQALVSIKCLKIQHFVKTICLKSSYSVEFHVDLRITKPDDVKEGYEEMLREIMERQSEMVGK